MIAKSPLAATAISLISLLMFSQNLRADDSKDFQCKIPSIVAQRTKLKERYEIVQKKEKYAIEALGGAISDSQSERLKPNSHNPFTVLTDAAIVGLTAGALATSAAALVLAPTLTTGAVTAGSSAIPVSFMFGATSGIVASVGADASIDLANFDKNIDSKHKRDELRYQISLANEKSAAFKKLEASIKSLPNENRAELISLDQYIWYQQRYFERMDVIEKSLDEILATQKTWTLPMHSNETNLLIAENQRQAAEAKRELLRRERELASSNRANLNLLCEHMMKNGATTSDSSSASLGSLSMPNSAAPKKSGGSGD